MRRRFRLPVLGGSPAILLLLTVSLLLTGYVIDKVVHAPKTVRISMWFVAAAILHDVVLFPAYALLDRSLVAAQAKWSTQRPPVINYIRVPAALAILFLLIWLPTILGRGTRTFLAASGLPATDEFLRWLLLSLVFFGVSGGLYLIRLIRVRRTTEEQS